MLDRLKKLVSGCSVDDWRITEERKVSHQAFFVKQELDQHRIADTTHTTLVIYVDRDTENGKMRGKYSREFYPSESDREILAGIEGMKFKASLAMNPWFELPAGHLYSEERKEYDLSAALRNLVGAVQDVRDTETESVNSYEVFVNEYYTRIVNSRGVDVSFNSMDEECEVIINSKGKDQEIELYHRVKFADRSLEDIRREILDVFAHAADRRRAVPTRKDTAATVIISGLDTREFFDYFRARTSASMVYNRMSPVQIGDECGFGDEADRISVEIRAHLPSSSANRPYSGEGVPAKDLVIVDGGTYSSYWGDRVNSYYLGAGEGVPANNFVVTPGSVSVRDMKKEPYLEIIQFSDFQTDPLNGNFGGEIRLAYCFDGEKTYPVTGGSITCNMKEAMKNVRFSKETRQIDNCIVPASIQLFGVAVAGEE